MKREILLCIPLKKQLNTDVIKMSAFINIRGILNPNVILSFVVTKFLMYKWTRKWRKEIDPLTEKSESHLKEYVEDKKNLEIEFY